MKTTLDLPDDLVKEVKLRALHENRKLKDAVADLLRKGLSAEESGPEARRRTRIKISRKSRLPTIECASAATPVPTPARIADLLLEQEVGWANEAGR